MFKRLSILFLIVFIFGCASVEVPNYIRDENPYKKTFVASYEDAMDAIEAALLDSGWRISKTVDPVVYERSRGLADEQSQQVLIFTEIRQMGLILGSRYARLNIYLLTGDDNVSEVEIRYLTSNSVGFKTFYNYRHDQSVKRLFQAIEDKLGLSGEGF